MAKSPTTVAASVNPYHHRTEIGSTNAIETHHPHLPDGATGDGNAGQNQVVIDIFQIACLLHDIFAREVVAALFEDLRRKLRQCENIDRGFLPIQQYDGSPARPFAVRQAARRRAQQLGDRPLMRIAAPLTRNSARYDAPATAPPMIVADLMASVMTSTLHKRSPLAPLASRVQDGRYQCPPIEGSRGVL
jgi:hypothetical protein